MAVWSRTPSLLLLAGTLAACGGGATMPRAQLVPGGAPVPAAGVQPSATIGGIVTTTTFTVPANQAILVTKPLAVFASKAVVISGALRVPRGIAVAFFTPSFTIAGPSGSIVTWQNKHYNGPADDLIDACQVTIANSSTIPLHVNAGDMLGITSSTKRNANHKHPCTVSVGVSKGPGNQGILLDPGVPGGSDPHRYTGQNGGWIEIGSPQAIAVTEALARADKHPTAAFAPDAIVLNSKLAAANGGAGQNDNIGSSVSGGYAFTAYPGGIGGSIQIDAGKITGSKPQMLAGNGGNGGSAALLFYQYPYTPPYPLDGTLQSENGVPATITMGSGGGGGGIFVTATVPKNVQERAGNGGNPSQVGPIRAGNACCTTLLYTDPVTGGGNGGSITLELAAPGIKGPNGNNKPSKPKSGKYSPISFPMGGAGFAWIIFGKAPVGATQVGGNGASLTVVPPPHIAIASLGSYGLKISLDNFGNASAAMLNCPQTPPGPPGIVGGAGGALHDNGLMQYIKATGTVYGFNGGNGSPGTPPGSGGAGGMNDEGQAIGINGFAGNPC